MLKLRSEITILKYIICTSSPSPSEKAMYMFTISYVLIRSVLSWNVFAINRMAATPVENCQMKRHVTHLYLANNANFTVMHRIKVWLPIKMINLSYSCVADYILYQKHNFLISYISIYIKKVICIFPHFTSIEFIGYPYVI